MFFHAKVVVPYNDVVEHLYSKNLSRFCEPSRNLAVLSTRLDLTTRMVVRQYNACSTRPNSRFKNLPGMDEGARERAYRNRGGLYYLVLGVEQQDNKVLPVKVGYAPPQQPVHVRGRGYHGSLRVTNLP